MTKQPSETKKLKAAFPDECFSHSDIRVFRNKVAQGWTFPFNSVLYYKNGKHGVSFYLNNSASSKIKICFIAGEEMPRFMQGIYCYCPEKFEQFMEVLRVKTIFTSHQKMEWVMEYQERLSKR